MLYTTCPTCGTFLGLKTEEYDQKKKIICDNPSLSKEEREKELSKLLLSLNLKRLCCKMRMMSYKDLVYDILPIYENK